MPTATSYQTPVFLPPASDELAKKAAERRAFLASLASGEAAFKAALAVTCLKHNAHHGHPCWRLGDASRGVCGDRISRAMGEAHRTKKALDAERERQKQIIAEGRRKRLRDGLPT